MKRTEQNSINAVWTVFRKMYPNVTVSQKELHKYLKENTLNVSPDLTAQLFMDYLRN